MTYFLQQKNTYSNKATLPTSDTLYEHVGVNYIETFTVRQNLPDRSCRHSLVFCYELSQIQLLALVQLFAAEVEDMLEAIPVDESFLL